MQTLTTAHQLCWQPSSTFGMTLSSPSIGSDRGFDTVLTSLHTIFQRNQDSAQSLQSLVLGTVGADLAAVVACPQDTSVRELAVWLVRKMARH